MLQSEFMLLATKTFPRMVAAADFDQGMTLEASEVVALVNWVRSEKYRANTRGIDGRPTKRD